MAENQPPEPSIFALMIPVVILVALAFLAVLVSRCFH